MPCSLDSLSQQTQPWNRIDTKVILAIQCGLMCDALNGIDPTTELNPIALAERLNCFAVLSQNQLMGIWTVLWAQWLAIIQAAGSGGGQIVTFVSDPNTEGVKPANVNSPALAYPQAGGTEYQWDVTNQLWV